MAETILLESKPPVATIFLNRPQKRNAINKCMIDEIREVLNLLRIDTSIRVLVITGSGEKSFAAGADIAELREKVSNDAFLAVNASLFHEIERFQKPVIASINGYALGGGLELALACDIRIASHTAKFGQPEVGLGIIPGAGATFRLAQIIGVAKAKEMIFTAQTIDSHEALSLGLVNIITEPEKLREETILLAKRIAEQSSLAVELSKKCINLAYQNSELQEYVIAAQALCFDSKDKYERMTKFLEKKK